MCGELRQADVMSRPELYRQDLLACEKHFPRQRVHKYLHTTTVCLISGDDEGAHVVPVQPLSPLSFGRAA